MTSKEISHVKRTWKIFQQIDPQLIGSTFYGKLFADHPNLRKMFPNDMTQQYQKIFDMLSTIVARLDHPHELEPSIRQMGKRHVQYGVKPAHFKMIGGALLWTLEHGLGYDWNNEVEKAWKECYKMMTTMMLEGMTD